MAIKNIQIGLIYFSYFLFIKKIIFFFYIDFFLK